ncbi:MAG TPA: CoA transferase [Candidatus Binatia bacterium]|jgi:crotonobetainyl-CoA:carnitine CoA-transferase CaiB-like acyl-CoA transferase
MRHESAESNLTNTSGSRFPLEGIRVVEFTTGIVGPTLGRLLAEFGAETIKVETIKRPDFSRGPAPDRINKGISFSDNSRSKKGLRLDVSRPEGREIVLNLIKISDIVVENFSAGVMQRLGLDYPRVAAVNPSIIMISLQGLGATERHSVTFGQNIPPIVGLSYLWNHPGASKPVGSELFYPDYYAGIHGACAVLAALDYRRRTGQGQYIDAAQAEAAAALLGPYYLDSSVNGRDPEPIGNGTPYAAPHGCYRCAGDDSWCVIAVYTEEEWRRFCEALGDPPWTRDPEFSTGLSRIRHRAKLDRLVEDWTVRHDAYEVMEQLQRAGVAAGVVQDAAQLANDPHLKARGFIAQTEHPEMGRLLHGGMPLKLSLTPGSVRSHAPLLGEHNRYVLRDLLQLDDETIQRLEKSGVFE